MYRQHFNPNLANDLREALPENRQEGETKISVLFYYTKELQEMLGEI